METPSVGRMGVLIFGPRDILAGTKISKACRRGSEINGWIFEYVNNDFVNVFSPNEHNCSAKPVFQIIEDTDEIVNFFHLCRKLQNTLKDHTKY